MTLASMRAAAREFRTARQQLDKATRKLKKEAIQHHHDGWPETVIADTLGISRGTVRRWLGK